MRTRSFLMPIAALAAAAVAGCGGSSKATGIQQVPSGGATGTTAATTPKPPPAIAKKAVNIGQYLDLLGTVRRDADVVLSAIGR